MPLKQNTLTSQILLLFRLLRDNIQSNDPVSNIDS